LSFLSWVLYIAIAIFVLLFMITVHEFGHWTAGKLLKFKINEFSIGFGKAIFQKTNKNGEKFSLRIFPLGGYCAFEGEDEDKKVEGAFNSQPPWKRLIVLFMGAFFNFLSAVVFSVIFLMAFGYADKVQVKSVTVPQSYVGQEESWLEDGDIILAVNGTPTDFVYDQYFNSLIADYEANETFSVTVWRDGKEVVLNNICRTWFALESHTDTTYGNVFSLDGTNFSYAITFDDATSTYSIVNIDDDGNILATYSPGTDGTVQIGDYKFLLSAGGDVSTSTISVSKIGISTAYYKYGFFEALGGAFVFCFKWVWKILIILWQLISGQIALSALGGTVTTVVTIAEVTSQNIANLLLLVPLISINLAVFNLLPIPALDGARMVFVVIEWVRGKPINRKIEANIHFVGLIVLLAFVAVVDILHFIL
jgi:regulator of sigma E protease